MKQKIVIKVHMTWDKCRKKALGIAASAHVRRSSRWRRSGGAKEKTKPADEAENAASAVAVCDCVRSIPADYYHHYYSRPAVVYPYAVHCFDDGFHSHADSWCTIM
ncbi:hypothetical protein EJB05_39200, partial [Eragrostis curvula]